jgi:CHAT domain-containing protein/tetratricopeptide (TPR) repeat protein
MGILSLLLAVFLGAAPPQEPSTASVLIELASTGSDEALVDRVRQHPDATREALHDLMRVSLDETDQEDSQASGAPPVHGDGALRIADRLARAYLEAWTDPFLIQQVQRFQSLSPTDRRATLQADSLRLLGNEAYGAQGIPPAMELWRKSLHLSEGLGDPVGAARARGNLGAGFLASGRPDSARAYLRDAYAGAAEAGDFRTAATAVTNLANLAFEEGDLTEAADRYSQATVILSRTGDNRRLSAIQHNLGLVALDLGDLPGARAALEQSIRLSRLHGYRGDEAEGLSSLADVAQAEGEYGEATELLNRALLLTREDGNRLAEAGAMHSLGLLNLARGDYGAARRLLETALGTYMELGALPDAGHVRQDLARTRVATGDIRGGLTELREARRITASVEPGLRAVGDLALASAELHLALGEYPAAMVLFEEAEASFTEASSLAGQAAAVEGQGLLSLLRGDEAEALGLLARSASLQAQAPRVDPRASSVTRYYLASAQEEVGDVDGARASLEEAREGLASVGDAVGEAAVLSVLGALEARSGAPQTADSLLARGLELLEDRSAPEVRSRLHAERAAILAASGRLAEASEEYHKAVRAVDGPIAGLPMESGLPARMRASDLLAARAGILLDLGEVGEAFLTSERSRARNSLTSISGGRLGIPPGAPAGLVEREQDLRRRLHDLAGATESGGWDPLGLREATGITSLRDADLRQVLEDTQREYAELLREMRTLSPSYASVVDPLVTGATEISSLLRPDEALLEYLITDDRAFVFVITSDTIAAVPLAMEPEPLADLIGFSRGATERGNDGGSPNLWRSPGQRLYGALLSPVEEEGLLEARNSLVIVPQGTLHYLPFQSLVDPRAGTFAIERYAISYAPSASTWARLRARAGEASEARVAPSVGEPSPGRRVLAMAPHPQKLPGSRYEAEVIGTIFGSDAQVLTGEDASEASFRNLAPEFDILHLATFGRLNRANPLFSRMELASTPGDPGLLEVHEIYGMRLDARLLTLSACETALGSGGLWDVPPGDEWVSLPSAFLAAGATNVLASLWRVDDLATAALMERFYAYMWDGDGVSNAIARAQRDLLADPATSHPYYWAGFVLVGEGGS